MTLRRLLASCPSNLAGTLDRLAERLREMHSQSVTPTITASAAELREMEKILLKPKRHHPTHKELEELQRESEELWELRLLANQTASAGKSQALLRALEEGFRSGKWKAVVFTEFLQTQRFLFELLRKKFRVVMMNGDNLNSQANEIYHA